MDLLRDVKLKGMLKGKRSFRDVFSCMIGETWWDPWQPTLTLAGQRWPSEIVGGMELIQQAARWKHSLQWPLKVIDIWFSVPCWQSFAMIIALRYPHILCFFKHAVVICIIFTFSFLRLPAQIQISHRPTLGPTCAVHLEPVVLPVR